jgi:hypothetical protein
MKDIPAFPIVVDYGDGVKYQTGMTLRDYFAAEAMHAVMTRSPHTPFSSVARYAYVQADAMMTEREATTQGIA